VTPTGHPMTCPHCHRPRCDPALLARLCGWYSPPVSSECMGEKYPDECATYLDRRPFARPPTPANGDA
jgi:hypothetical protein